MARPALEPAHPSGAVAGTLQPVERAACDVLMDDGSWGYAEAMGWAQDISGPWRIRLLYDDAGRQRDDWWLYDAGRVRLAKGGPLAQLDGACAACPGCCSRSVRAAARHPGSRRHPPQQHGIRGWPGRSAALTDLAGQLPSGPRPRLTPAGGPGLTPAPPARYIRQTMT